MVYSYKCSLAWEHGSKISGSNTTRCVDDLKSLGIYTTPEGI